MPHFNINDSSYEWAITDKPEILKENGTPIKLNYFSSDQYKGISGVLFSKVGINQLQIPLSSKLATDFIFVRNPLAENKLPIGWLKAGNEYYRDDHKLKKITYENK